MIDLLLLALKDVLRHFHLLFLMLMAIFLMALIFASGTASVYYSPTSDSRICMNEYDFIPIDTDTSGSRKLADSFQIWMEGKGMTWTNSSYLSEKAGKTTFVVIGDPSLFYFQLDATEHIQVYEANGSQNEREIRLGHHVYPVEQIQVEEGSLPEPIYYLGKQDHFLIFYIVGEEISPWISHEQGLEATNLLENAVFYRDASEYEKELRELTAGSFLALGKYSDNPNYSMSGEERFVRGYLYPSLFMMLLCTLCFFRMFYKHFLRRMYREYALHLLYGATLRDILLRNSILMILAFLLLSFAFWYISRGETAPVMVISYFAIAAILGAMEGIMALTLCRDDRIKHAKGVD